MGDQWLIPKSSSPILVLALKTDPRAQALGPWRESTCRRVPSRPITVTRSPIARPWADAATQLAQAIEAHPAAAESLRLLLAKNWIAMGEQLSKAPGGSMLLVDPQSPVALVTALQGLQGEKG